MKILNMRLCYFIKLNENTIINFPYGLMLLRPILFFGVRCSRQGHIVCVYQSHKFIIGLDCNLDFPQIIIYQNHFKMPIVAQENQL